MKKRKKINATPAYDWFLSEWMMCFGKIQADLERELEWNKSKASLMWHREQRYHRDDINQVADWLHLRPYELLMHPEEAMTLRRMRESAIKIATDNLNNTNAGLQAESKLKIVNG